MILYYVATFLILSSPSFAYLKEPLDLTWNFEKGVQTFKFTKQIVEFCPGEHGGTHLDAPYHFSEHGIGVGEIPLNSLIVNGVVVDISEEVDKYGPTTNLKASHLDKWVETHGPIPNHTVILVKFGWSKYWPDKNKYFNIQDNGEYFFPGITKKAAQWIVDTKKVVGVGVDVASVDPGTSNIYDAYVTMNGLYLLENVNIRDELPARNFTLIVAPMKILYGTGAPLRLIAMPFLDFV